MYKLLAVFLFFTLLTKAQCPGPSGGAANCDPILSEIRMDTPNFVDFTFDSFSKINGGIQKEPFKEVQPQKRWIIQVGKRRFVEIM